MITITVTPLNGDEGEIHTADTFINCVRQMLDCFEASESPDWCMWVFMPAIAEFSRLIYAGESQGEYMHRDICGEDFKITFEVQE